MLLWPSPAAGAQQCDKRENVLRHLAWKYQEKPIGQGVTNTGGLVELLTTEDRWTWTIIVTTPQGMSCLVAAGEGWRQVKPKPEGTAL